jgi:hypothetical protein
MQGIMLKRVAFTAVLAPLLVASSARAEESVLKQPDQHPSYFAELDVHGLFAYWGTNVGPFALGRYGTAGLGPGVRASFNILKDGFIPKLNDSVAIGVGGDLVFGFDGTVRLVTPVVLQWNFWLTQHWSVFGEPGIAIEFPMSVPASSGGEPIYLSPALFAGGRYNFNDHVTFTFRIGFPMSTIGVSFLL